MRKLVIGLVAIAGMFLLSGCGFDPTPRKYTEVGGRYFYVPNRTGTTKRLSKLDAFDIRYFSGIPCRKGDILWMSTNESAKKNYRDWAQLKKTYKKGYTGCTKPISRQKQRQLDRYREQQRRINNDPRVVAARIQANAINKQAMMARWNNLGEGYNTSNYYKSNQNTGFSYPDYGSDDSFSLNRKSTTYRATRLSDGVYNVRKRNSAPRF